QDAYPAAHRLKTLAPARVEWCLAGPAAGKAAGELNHETGVDAVLAGRGAVAAAAAYRGPARSLRSPAAAGDQIDDARRGLLGIGLGEARRRHHRASAKAIAAARAGIGDRLATRPEILEIQAPRATFGHTATWSFTLSPGGYSNGAVRCKPPRTA